MYMKEDTPYKEQYSCFGWCNNIFKCWATGVNNQTSKVIIESMALLNYNNSHHEVTT